MKSMRSDRVQAASKSRTCPCPRSGRGRCWWRWTACGICGSDVHGMDGSTGRRQPADHHGPRGRRRDRRRRAQASSGWADGRPRHLRLDRSTAADCWFCRRGRDQPLRQPPRAGRLLRRVPPRRGLRRVRGRARSTSCYRLPDGAVLRAGRHGRAAVDRRARRRPDARSAWATRPWWSARGMIGLLVVQALRAAGCGRIIAVDLDAGKLDLACRLGADEGVQPQQCDVAAEMLAADRRSRGRRGHRGGRAAATAVPAGRRVAAQGRRS